MLRRILFPVFPVSFLATSMTPPPVDSLLSFPIASITHTHTLSRSAMPPTPTPPQKLNRSKPKCDDLSLATSPLVSSRKSDRKRKYRVIPDSAPTFKISQASASRVHKSWTDSEEVALLKAAARFRARTGLPPRTPDMEEFFESVKSSFGSGMDQVRVFYKLKRLKSKFLQTDGPLSGPHERLIYKLSAEVWGSEASPKHGREIEEILNYEEEGEMENGSALVTEALREYWRENGKMISGALLGEGLRFMDPTQAVKLEMKWRQQVESDMRLKMKRHDIFKEVHSLLAHAVKNS